MAKIELRGVGHSYEVGREAYAADPNPDATFVIRDLDLTWDDQSANALLGPSGCGKTTILNIISALLQPTLGSVLVDGVDVTDASPRDRHIAQVFQFPVVYDTVTVFGNLAFPLRNAGVPTSEIAPRVEKIAEILELGHLLKVSAGRISQAEKQKVSLGRGIVRQDTAAILLDEPLTVIDPKEKYVLRRKLREVQRELNITMIYVTHDQHEAMTFADQVMVMNQGEVVQVGTPADLHTDPASPFVGYFIGSPGMNLLDCRREGAALVCDGMQVDLSPAVAAALDQHSGKLQMGIRPEFVDVRLDNPGGWTDWTARLVENMGTHQMLTLTRDALEIRCRATEDMTIPDAAKVWTRFPEDRLKVFADGKKVN